jgi:Leucine-rich repeat (LRR) protein
MLDENDHGKKFINICANVEKILSMYSNISVKIDQYHTQAIQKISALDKCLNSINTEISHLESNTITPSIIESNKKKLVEIPHSAHSRICWDCKKTLNFIEIYEQNRDLEKERLSKLWNHPSIQFYCCACFDRIKQEEISDERREKSKLIRKNLKPEEREGLSFVERRIGKEIIATSDFKIKSTQYWSRIPEFIAKDKHIIALKLNYCALTSIPIDLQLFISLNYLDLSYNHIESLPQWIKFMISLKQLILLGNPIVNIPESFFLIKNLEILPVTIRNKQIQEKMKSSMRAINSEVRRKIGSEIPVKY